MFKLLSIEGVKESVAALMNTEADNDPKHYSIQRVPSGFLAQKCGTGVLSVFCPAHDQEHRDFSGVDGFSRTESRTQLDECRVPKTRRKYPSP